MDKNKKEPTIVICKESWIPDVEKLLGKKIKKPKPILTREKILNE